MPVEQITYRQRLRGRLTAVGPGLADVELSGAEPTPLGDEALFTSQLVFATERAFSQQGTLDVSETAAAIRLTAVGSGELAESPARGVLHGTAVLELHGAGALGEARGRITSNFVVAADGAVTDEQVVVLFIDKQGGPT